MKNMITALILSTSLFSVSTIASAQNNESTQSQTVAEKAAKELANPNTAYASLNLKFQHFGGYEAGGSSFSTTFQPILPFPLDNGDKVIFRPAISYIESDYKAYGVDAQSGVSDISFDLAYATTFGGDPTNLLATGIFATLPTGSDELTRDQFAVGPELFLGKLSEQRIFGALNTHQWGFASNNDSIEEVNRTGVQLIYVEILGGGWTVGSAPQMSYDWNKDQAEIPLNLTVSKTTVLGGRPWKFAIEANYYIEKDEKVRPDFMIGLNITPVVENKLVELF